MKKAVLLVFILAGLALAQHKKVAKPNLSGAWALDRSKSKLGQLAPGQFAGADLRLLIEHRDPQINVLYRLNFNGQEITWRRVFYSDGRGEVNSWSFGGNQVKSRTRWEGASLVSAARVGERDAFERWELSRDGKVLTVTVSMAGQTVKLVFDRQQ